MGAVFNQQQSATPGWLPMQPPPTDVGPGNVLPEKQGNPLVPEGTLSQGQAVTDTAKQVGSAIQEQRAKASAEGLWDEQTGLPTAAGVRDAARKYAFALVAGTGGPKSIEIKAGAPPSAPSMYERFGEPTTFHVRGDTAYSAPVLGSSTVRDVLAPVTYENAPGISKDMLPLIRDKVVQKSGDTPVHTVEPDLYDRATSVPSAGFYHPGDDHIVLRDSELAYPEWAPQLALHEAAHAASVHEIHANPGLEANLGGVMKDAVDAHVASGGDRGRVYGFTNTEEFLAEAMANPTFQEQLRQTPLSPEVAKQLGLNARGKQTAWSGVVDTVRKSLNLPPKSFNTLAGVMHVGDQLLPAGGDTTLSKALQGVDTREARAAVRDVAGKAVGPIGTAVAPVAVAATTGTQAPPPPEQRNAPYVKEEGDHEYNTPLRPADETRFRKWVSDNKVPFDPNASVSDYDMRGLWKQAQDPDGWAALQKSGKLPKDVGPAQTKIDPNDGKPHWPDYWKTPLHETFSNESKWAKPNAPRWNDRDQLVDKNGKVIFDDRAK